MAVIGFSGSEITAFLEPPLSTVQIDNREVGYRAVRLLLERLGPAAAAPAPVWIEPRLTVRASTAPAGARSGRP